MQTRLATAVAEVVARALPQAAGLSANEVAALLEAPPDRNLGDFAFPCFRLAKALRMAPPKIAAELADNVETGGIVEHVTAAGPYLNVRVDLARAAALTLPRLASSKAGIAAQRSEKVMVEYSQPNTHKAFHVGHMRTLFLGDALVRLLRADGYEVVAANYLGDVGAHIARCLWWYLDVVDDAARQPPATARGEWLGEMYVAATNQLADWEDAAKAGDAAAQAELDRAKTRSAEILKKLETRDPELLDVWTQSRRWSLDDFDEIYRWCTVTFDRVFYESEVDEPGLAIVEEYLQKGVFVESEGAVGIFNEEVKHMPFFMLRRSDGTGLYSNKDLALARLKFEEHNIDRSIYVVDARQTDHFRHVFLTLAKMGFEQAARCEHVPYEMVELPSGAMSTRKGTVILFQALRERLLAHLEATYLGKYRGDWPDEEIDEVAHYLALGAIKYGMLNRDVNQKIVFELEAWLNLEGNTGPYLQYAAARAGSIVRIGAQRGKVLDPAVLTDEARARTVAASLKEPEERDLLLTLDGVEVAAHGAAQALRPSLFCTYLYSLAKAANRFANAKNCRVVQSDGDLLQARLLLVAATREALVWGLDLLGIPSPKRM